MLFCSLCRTFACCILSQQIVFFLTFHVFGSWAYQEICMLCFVTTNSVLFNLSCLWILGLPRNLHVVFVTTNSVLFNLSCLWILGLPQQIVFFLTFYIFGSWAYQEICMLCFVTTNSVLFNLSCLWIFRLPINLHVVFCHNK